MTSWVNSLNLSGETKSFFFSGWRCKSGSKWTRRMLILTLKHPIIWISGSRWLFTLSCRMVPKCTDETKGTEMKCAGYFEREKQKFSLVTPGFPSFYSKEPAEFTRSFRGERLSRLIKTNRFFFFVVMSWNVQMHILYMLCVPNPLLHLQ